MGRTKIIWADDHILYDGNYIAIVDLVDYYINQNHSGKETREHFHLNWHPGNILKKYNIYKPRELYYENKKKTLLKLYGSETYNNMEQNKETCLKKYGVDNIFKQVDYITACRKDKMGVDYPIQLESVKEKMKKTCVERYGVENPMQSEQVKEKLDNTVRERYGVDHIMQVPEFAAKNASPLKYKKVWATKLTNGTCNTSKAEDLLYDWLCNLYGEIDVIRNYDKDFRYPYHVDFYVKSIDLFIELNFHWTHMKHPFCKDNLDDIKELEKLKEKAKTSKYYEAAIDVWTIGDIKKQQCAKESNLYYMVIYNEVELKKVKETLKNDFNSRKCG